MGRRKFMESFWSVSRWGVVRRLLWCCDAWNHRYRLISIRKPQVFWSQDSTLDQHPSPNFFYVRKRNVHLNQCLLSFPFLIVKQCRQVQGRGMEVTPFPGKAASHRKVWASFSVQLKWSYLCVLRSISWKHWEQRGAARLQSTFGKSKTVWRSYFGDCVLWLALST